MKYPITILTPCSFPLPPPDDMKDVLVEYYSPGGTELTETIALLQPDAVLLELFMPQTDAVGILRLYRSLFRNAHPFFAVCCPFLTEHLRQELLACGADWLITVPPGHAFWSDLATLARRSAWPGRNATLRQVHRVHQSTPDLHLSDFAARSSVGIPPQTGKPSRLHERAEKCSRAEKRGTIALAEQAAEEVLCELGVPQTDEGYVFLRRAIAVAASDASVIRSVYRTLYPAVAEAFGVPFSRVERHIRSAILQAFRPENREAVTAYFGHTVDNLRGIPVSSEFISLLADRIRLRLGCRPPDDPEFPVKCGIHSVKTETGRRSEHE